MAILDELATYAKERVAADRARRPLRSLRAEAEGLASDESSAHGGFRHPFRRALSRPELSFICEVKKASPSKGIIAEDFPYLSIAATYERAGADAISVLTEPRWFLGSDRIFSEIAHEVTTPLLRKDFTVDEYQIYQAKCLGASAVLLICSILSDGALRDFRLLAEELGMDALAETHDATEVERALRSDGKILGVNNRDLRDFSVSFDNAASLRNVIPEDKIFVAESGVKTADDVAQVAALGADGVLIGETLMRSADIEATLREFHMAATQAAPPKAKRQAVPEVKLCGLCQPEDVAAFNELQPDFAGLVFYPPSSRVVDVDEARALRAALDPRIRTVGVFVDADPAFITQLADEEIISAAQLHGHEDEAYLAQLRSLAPSLEIWQAFLVKGPETLAAARASSADRVLLDASLGGGEPFDWSVLDAMERPYMLAGGLNPHNVAEAIARYAPMAVDVSSGIEADERASDGRTRKDRGRMKAFIDAVRQ